MNSEQLRRQITALILQDFQDLTIAETLGTLEFVRLDLIERLRQSIQPQMEVLDGSTLKDSRSAVLDARAIQPDSLNLCFRAQDIPPPPAG